MIYRHAPERSGGLCLVQSLVALVLILFCFAPRLRAASTPPAATAPTVPPRAAAVYAEAVGKWQTAEQRYLPDPNDIPADVRAAAEHGLPTENGRFVIPRRSDGDVIQMGDADRYAVQYYAPLAKPAAITGRVVDDKKNSIPFATVPAHTDFDVGGHTISSCRANDRPPWFRLFSCRDVGTGARRPRPLRRSRRT
jgi:hypothetical protein